MITATPFLAAGDLMEQRHLWNNPRAPGAAPRPQMLRVA